MSKKHWATRCRQLLLACANVLASSQVNPMSFMSRLCPIGVSWRRHQYPVRRGRSSVRQIRGRWCRGTCRWPRPSSGRRRCSAGCDSCGSGSDGAPICAGRPCATSPAAPGFTHAHTEAQRTVTTYRPGDGETIPPPANDISIQKSRRIYVRPRTSPSPHISGGRQWLSCRQPACV